MMMGRVSCYCRESEKEGNQDLTCQSALAEKMKNQRVGQSILYDYAYSAEFAIQYLLEQVQIRPCPMKEEECDAEAVHRQIQNHHAGPSKIDKVDVDPCLQHTYEHIQDSSNLVQKEKVDPTKLHASKEIIDTLS